MSSVVETVFDVGDRARLGNHVLSVAEAAAGVAIRYAFTSLGVITDPNAVTLTLLLPDGTETAWAWPTPGVGQETLLREAAGRFYADYTWVQAGVHWVRLAGAGSATAAVEFAVLVRSRQVA